MLPIDHPADPSSAALPVPCPFYSSPLRSPAADQIPDLREQTQMAEAKQSPGWLDFLMGRGALKQAAGQAPAATPPPPASDEGMRRLREAVAATQPQPAAQKPPRRKPAPKKK